MTAGGTDGRQTYSLTGTQELVIRAGTVIVPSKDIVIRLATPEEKATIQLDRGPKFRRKIIDPGA